MKQFYQTMILQMSFLITLRKNTCLFLNSFKTEGF